jgi:hypothetical protein
MNFLKSIRVRSTPRVSQEGAIDSRYQMIIPPDWLRKKITVEEAEADNPGISDDRVARFPDAVRPFGFLNRQWETLKAEINKPRFDTALRACARARHAKLEMERPSHLRRSKKERSLVSVGLLTGVADGSIESLDRS